MRSRVACFLAVAAAVPLLALPRGAAAQVTNSGGAVGTSLTVNTLATGTVLNVGGAVSADGRYVTLSMQPSFSSLEGFDTFSTGGSGAASAAFAVHSIPFRSAVVGRLTFVEPDAGLLARSVKPTVLANTSFKAALQKVAAATNTNIVLGIRGMQQAGIDVETPHTFTLQAGTLKDAVMAILKTAVPDEDLVITAEDDVLRVATQAQSDATVVTRMYDLDDFLANIPRFVPATMDLGTFKDDKDKTAANLTAKRGSPAAPKPMAARGRTGTSAPPPAQRRPQPAQGDSDLLRLVTASVRPEIWKCNGGKYSDIAIAGSRVVVTAPESVQVLFTGPARPKESAPRYIGVGH